MVDIVKFDFANTPETKNPTQPEQDVVDLSGIMKPPVPVNDSPVPSIPVNTGQSQSDVVDLSGIVNPQTPEIVPISVDVDATSAADVLLKRLPENLKKGLARVSAGWASFGAQNDLDALYGEGATPEYKDKIDAYLSGQSDVLTPAEAAEFEIQRSPFTKLQARLSMDKGEDGKPINLSRVAAEQTVSDANLAVRQITSETMAEQANPNLSGLEKTILSAAQSTGFTAPVVATGLGAFLLTRDAKTSAEMSLLGLAASTQAAETQQALMDGADPSKAKLHGAISGLAEAGFEMIPLGKLIDLPGGKNKVKDVINFFAREIGSEMATTAVQSASEKMLVNPDMTAKDFEQAMYDTVITTPFTAGMQVGAVHITSEVADKLNEKVQAGLPKIKDYLDQKALQLQQRFFTPPFTSLGEGISDVNHEMRNATEERERFQKLVNEAIAEASAITQSLNDADEINGPQELFRHKFPGWDTASTDFIDMGANSAYWNIPGAQSTLTETMQLSDPSFEGALVDGITTPEGKGVYTSLEAFMRSPETIGVTFAKSKTNEAFRPDDPSHVMAHKNNLLYQNAMKRAVAKVNKLYRSLMPDKDAKLLISAPAFDDLFAIPNPKDKRLGGWQLNVKADEGNFALVHLNKGMLQYITEVLKDKTLVPEKFYNLFAEMILAHEMGHAIVAHAFAKTPAPIQAALKQEYRNLVAQNYEKGTFESFGRDQYSSIRYTDEITNELSWERRQAELEREAKGEHDKKSGRASMLVRRSMSNFDEFLADQFARKNPPPEVFQFVKDSEVYLKRLYSLTKEMRGTFKSFDAFTKYLASGPKLEQAEARVRRAEETYRSYLDGLRDVYGVNPTGETGNGAPPNGAQSPTTGNAHGGAATPPGGMRTLLSAIMGHYTGNPISQDRFTWTLKVWGHFTNIVRYNSHRAGVRLYQQGADEFWRVKNVWASKASNTLRTWLGFKAERVDQIDKYMWEVEALTDEKLENGMPQPLYESRLQLLIQRYGMTAEELNHVQRVQADLKEGLNEIERLLDADLRQQALDNPQNALSFLKRRQDLHDEFAKMKARFYLPRLRFGEFTVTAYNQAANHPEFRLGETMEFHTFATEAQAKKKQKELALKYKGNASIAVGKLTPEVHMNIELPQAVSRILATRLGLTPEQMKELSDVQAMLAPGQGLRKHFMKKKDVEGFSKDLMRNYASYMSKLSNHIARLSGGPLMQKGIEDLKKTARFERQNFPMANTTKLEDIATWLQRHNDYMMKPAEEAVALRALGAFWWLGFVPAAAAINFTQVPLISYPYLAQKYNDVAAVSQLSKAMGYVMKRRLTGHFDQEVEVMFAELTAEGILDETNVTELAALQEGGFILRKLLGGGDLMSPHNAVRMQRMLEMSMFMFQAAEVFNRKVTAMAAYKLARKRGHDHTQAKFLAGEAVKDTQYQYGRINRPEVMRGPIGSVVLLFWQYITNTLWFIKDFKSAGARFLIMMLALAGYEGLPFVGNLLDVLDASTRKIKELTGWTNPKEGIRDEIEKYLAGMEESQTLPFSAETLKYGLGHNILDVMDIQGNLSMGRIVPGTEMLTKSGSLDDAVGGMAQQASGAVAGIGLDILSAVSSKDPSLLKMVEKMLPRAGKGPVAAYRWATEGERDSYGNLLKEFNLSTFEDAAAIAARAGGFQNPEIKALRQRSFETYDDIKYYKERQQILGQRFIYDFNTGKDLGPIMEELNRYNAQVPYPEMQMKFDVKTLKENKARFLLQQQGLSDEKKFIRLAQDSEKKTLHEYKKD